MCAQTRRAIAHIDIVSCVQCHQGQLTLGRSEFYDDRLCILHREHTSCYPVLWFQIDDAKDLPTLIVMNFDSLFFLFHHGTQTLMLKRHVSVLSLRTVT